MRLSLISLIALFSSLALAQNYSFSKYEPSPQRVEGVDYPRKGQVLYRGMQEGQFELKKALRTLLGDESSLIESLFFTTIKKKILNESFDHAVSLDADVLQKISDVRSKYNNQISKTSAVKETIKIVEAYFKDLERRSLVESLYFDYSSSRFIDWPQDVVYSSLIQPAAATYGYNMAMIREDSGRSLDMNFYNWVKNGFWRSYTRDVAEFVAPGFIPAEHVIGFQLRDTTGHKGWHRIRYAFIKRNHNGEDYIEVYSGYHPTFNTLSSCMSLDSSEDLFHCNYRPGSLAMEIPPVSNQEASFLGIIGACDTRSECLRNLGDINAPNLTSDRSLEQDISRVIRSTEVSGKSLKYISANEL